MATQMHDLRIDPMVCAPDADALPVIRERDVALSIWQRPVPSSLAAPLAALDCDGVDDIGLTVDLPVAPRALSANLIAAGYGETLAVPLAADMADLAERFAAVVGCSRVKLRLDVVETDACRRFHADYVTYRMLTTYHGAATQWARSDAPDAIKQMRAGEVAIFKGRALLDEAPILHRSPPIAGTGEKRLLFVIDPVIAD